MTNEGSSFFPFMPPTPPPFQEGFLRKGGKDHPVRRENLAWLAENGETSSIRRKAQEILEGKRSSYELFRDPEFGEIIAEGYKQFEKTLTKEGISIDDLSTLPSDERLQELERIFTELADLFDEDADTERESEEPNDRWFDRRTKESSFYYEADERFGPGSRDST